MSIVIDADTPWVLDPADLKSQCKNTPFDEARFSGRVVRTIVGGRTVYRACLTRVLEIRRISWRERRCRLMPCCRRVRRRLSARLDSVRADPDQARRHAGSALDRLRQYRRHQRAAHRPQGPRRGDAARRHAQGHGRGHHRRLFRRPERARCWPRSAPSSAISFRSGSNLRRQRRRDLYRRAARPVLAGGVGVLRDVAR